MAAGGGVCAPASGRPGRAAERQAGQKAAKICSDVARLFHSRAFTTNTPRNRRSESSRLMWLKASKSQCHNTFSYGLLSFRQAPPASSQPI
eukprot:4977504-Pleurochrysis_carterae.AAC.11